MSNNITALERICVIGLEWGCLTEVISVETGKVTSLLPLKEPTEEVTPVTALAGGPQKRSPSLASPFQQGSQAAICLTCVSPGNSHACVPCSLIWMWNKRTKQDFERARYSLFCGEDVFCAWRILMTKSWARGKWTGVFVDEYPIPLSLPKQALPLLLVCLSQGYEPGHAGGGVAPRLRFLLASFGPWHW